MNWIDVLLYASGVAGITFMVVYPIAYALGQRAGRADTGYRYVRQKRCTDANHRRTP